MPKGVPTIERRRELCSSEGITLNGAPARITNATGDFASVVQLETGLGAECQEAGS